MISKMLLAAAIAVIGVHSMQREEKVDDDKNVWECSGCTFENNYLLKYCEICGKPRGGSPLRRARPVHRLQAQCSKHSIQAMLKAQAVRPTHELSQENLSDYLRGARTGDIVLWYATEESIYNQALAEDLYEETDNWLGNSALFYLMDWPKHAAVVVQNPVTRELFMAHSGYDDLLEPLGKALSEQIKKGVQVVIKCANVKFGAKEYFQRSKMALEFAERCIKDGVKYRMASLATFIQTPQADDILKMMMRLFNLNGAHGPIGRLLGGKCSKDPSFSRDMCEAHPEHDADCWGKDLYLDEQKQARTIAQVKRKFGGDEQEEDPTKYFCSEYVVKLYQAAGLLDKEDFNLCLALPHTLRTPHFALCCQNTRNRDGDVMFMGRAGNYFNKEFVLKPKPKKNLPMNMYGRLACLLTRIKKSGNIRKPSDLTPDERLVLSTYIESQAKTPHSILLKLVQMMKGLLRQGK